MPRVETTVKFVLALAATLVAACGPKSVDQGPPLPDECPPPGDRKSVHWYQVADPAIREELKRWCALVGPPIAERTFDAPDPQPLDSLVVVSWNAHVGGGSLGLFIRQLRGGVLTGGRRVTHFVMLLQETFRDGDEVPGVLPEGGRYAEVIFPDRELGVRRDVRQVAREEGLYVYYVPSMRNGADAHAREDRGNAILSTLPLNDHIAWELPLRYQRRVSIGASVEGVTTGGDTWRLSLVNLHLDNRTGIRTLVRSFSRVRELQTEFVLNHLPCDGAVILGGDLNTWMGEGEEPAVRRIRETFTVPDPLPVHGTLKFGAILERQTDFLFFRLPGGWRARYRRIDDTYGSDHYPLVGWVVFADSRNEVDSE